MLDKSKVNIKVGGDFEPLPADKYTAQVSDVTLATQYNNFKGVEEDLLNFQFTILDDKETEDGESTRGRLVWQRVTQSLSARSKLGKLAIAIFGRELTKEEMETFDPEALLGKQVDIMVVQNPSKTDSTVIYNNIISVSKAIKKLKAVEAVEKPAAIVKKTVAAVAPDAEDPEKFINNLEAEKVEGKTEAAPDDDAEAEAEALAAESEAAELAAKAARARADAAKARAKINAKK